MKEKKFKVYDLNTNEVIATDVDLEKIYLYIFDGDAITEQEGNVIVEYTGLKDKNGNKIYEGDIVKGHWWKDGHKHRHIGRVAYVVNSFVVRGVKQYFGFDDCYLNPTYEIIGNIYENPEMIK